MKLLFIFLSLLVANACLYAQDINYITTKLGKDGQRITNVDSSGIISVDNISIEKLTGNKKFGLMSIEYLEARNEGIYDNCVRTAHHTYFPVLLFPSSDKEDLSVVEVDAKGKIKGGLKPVLEHDFDKRRKGQQLNLGTAGLILSKDKQLMVKITPMAICYTQKPAKLSITVLDEGLKTIWHKIQDFPYLDKDLVISDALLTNTGKLVLIAWVSKQKTNKKDDDGPQADYKAFVITKDGMKESVFYNDNQRINSSNNMAYENEDKVTIAGFYSTNSIEKGKKLVTIAGTYIIDFDLKACSPTSKAFYPFDDSTINEMADKSYSPNLVAGDISAVALLNNGPAGFTLVTHRTSITSTSTHYGSSIVRNVQYGSFQKLLIGFDSQLKKRFETVISDNFTSSFPGGANIAAFIANDKTLLIYNVGSGASNSCVAALLDASGKVIQQKGLGKPMSDYEFRPDVAWQLNDSKVIINYARIEGAGRYSDTDVREAVVTVK